MGGGVALELAGRRPRRVRSLTLLSSIGVQELELLGDHLLNRGVHALQLAAVWALHEATPHFGRLDGFPLDVPYARNFYDSDQRPLRGILGRARDAGAHRPRRARPAGAGERRPRAPPAGAAQRAADARRQSLHGLCRPRPAGGADRRVSSTGSRPATRAAARGGRARAARRRRPAVRSRGGARRGRASPCSCCWRSSPLATLVSEDLTCIATGLLVSQGRVGLDRRQRRLRRRHPGRRPADLRRRPLSRPPLAGPAAAALDGDAERPGPQRRVVRSPRAGGHPRQPLPAGHPRRHLLHGRAAQDRLLEVPPLLLDRGGAVDAAAGRPGELAGGPHPALVRALPALGPAGGGGAGGGALAAALAGRQPVELGRAPTTARRAAAQAGVGVLAAVGDLSAAGALARLAGGCATAG